MRWLLPVLMVGICLAAFLAGRSSKKTCEETQVRTDGQEELLDHINRYRLENSLEPLEFEIHLEAAAQWFAQDMYEKSYFSHTDSLGRNMSERLAAFDYPTNTYLAENLALDYGPRMTFDAWVDSPAHNAALLNPFINEVGIGVAGNIWVFDAGEAVAPPPLITPASTPATPEPVLVLTPEPLPEVTPCQ